METGLKRVAEIGHFRVAFCLCVKTSLRAKPLTWKCVPLACSFSCKSNSFSYERFSKKTCLETEAQLKVTWKWPIELNSNFI